MDESKKAPIEAQTSKGEETRVEVFSATIRLKSGRILYAKDFGLKAFHFFAKAK